MLFVVIVLTYLALCVAVAELRRRHGLIRCATCYRTADPGDTLCARCKSEPNKGNQP